MQSDSRKRCTDVFKVRCCGTKNLHQRFRRWDSFGIHMTHALSRDFILVYVDDLFLIPASEQRLQIIAEKLTSKYDSVTYKTGKEHDFLDIHWNFSIPGQSSLPMDGYVVDVITKYNVTKQCRTPATDRLFHTTADSPLLTSEKRELFRSCVMTLYYLAKRIRPEILIAISY